MYQQQQQRQYRIHQNTHNPTLRGSSHLKHTTAPGSSSIITSHPLAVVVVAACISLFVAYLTHRVRRGKGQGGNTASFSSSGRTSWFIGLVLSYLIRVVRERYGRGSVRLEDGYVADCEQQRRQRGGNGRWAGTKAGQGCEDGDDSRISRCEMEELGMGVSSPNTAVSVAAQDDDEDLIELHGASRDGDEASTPQSSTPAPDYLSTPISSSELSATPSPPLPPPPVPTLSSLNLSPSASPQDRLRALKAWATQREESQIQKDGIWHTEVECLAGLGEWPIEKSNMGTRDEVEEGRIKLEYLRRLELSRADNSATKSKNNDVLPQPLLPTATDNNAQGDEPDTETEQSSTPQSTTASDEAHSIVVPRISITRKAKRASVGITKPEDDDDEDVRLNGELVNSGSMQVKGVREVREDFDVEIGARER